MQSKIYQKLNQKIKLPVLQFLYPNRCPGCDAFLPACSTVCDACADSMSLKQDSYCHRCGKISCFCRYKKLFYDDAVIACRYENAAVPSVLKLKQTRNTNFAVFSARILAQRLQNPAYGRADFIVPVPMHPAEIRRRGYNQAALIAAELSGLLEIPCRDDILFRKKSVSQHLLNAQERAKNVENFGIYPVSFENLHMILCDDVLTTGNTMSRCAELLKSAGAVRVTAASAATALKKADKKFINN
ncbi:MAG: ComF family protein [Oscillospiraceae bacterium]|nr:ComF family protein [Oscillospiraceae bacterium]